MLCAVASVEPSSITMISEGGSDWFSTDRIAAVSRSSRLNVGITTDTVMEFVSMFRHCLDTPPAWTEEASSWKKSDLKIVFLDLVLNGPHRHPERFRRARAVATGFQKRLLYEQLFRLSP